jgi:hypothetical protein
MVGSSSGTEFIFRLSGHQPFQVEDIGSNPIPTTKILRDGAVGSSQGS